MSTANMTITEAMHDTYWGGGGGGVAPNIGKYTKPTKFLCRNQIGKLLHSIRSEVQESVSKYCSSYSGFIFPKPPTHEKPDMSSLSNSALLTTPPFDVTKKHDLLKMRYKNTTHYIFKQKQPKLLYSTTQLMHIHNKSHLHMNLSLHVLHSDLAQNQLKMCSTGNFG